MWICSILLIGYLVAVLFAIKKNKELKAMGFEGIPTKECFSPKKMFSVLLGYVIGMIPLSYIDQYILRYAHRHEFVPDDGGEVDVMQGCRQCINENKSINCSKPCGCPPKFKAASPFEKCEGRYSPIMSEKKFNEFYKELEFEIIIKFKNRK